MGRSIPSWQAKSEVVAQTLSKEITVWGAKYITVDQDLWQT